MEKPFSLKFFISALGYHREVRKGKGVYVKKLARQRFSIITPEVFNQEYEQVCKCLSLGKKENIKNANG